MATVATDTALAPPALERATLGLLTDPLSVRRLETLLGSAFSIVSCAEDAETLHGDALVPMEVAVLTGGGELLARGGAVERLRSLAPSCRLVIMAKTEDRSLIRKAVRAGVGGFVREGAAADALIPTIEAVLAGQLAVPQTIRARVAWRLFSLRERQVLQLVAAGLTNGEIAYRLCLSESTVKSHLSSSFRKLGVSSRAEAAAIVLDPESGLHTVVPPRALMSLEQQLIGPATPVVQISVATTRSA